MTDILSSLNKCLFYTTIETDGEESYLFPDWFHEAFLLGPIVPFSDKKNKERVEGIMELYSNCIKVVNLTGHDMDINTKELFQFGEGKRTIVKLLPSDVTRKR